MAKKAAVTGGEGFIGTHLVGELKERGYDVLSIDIKSGFDILDKEKLADAFQGVHYVFHTAALPRVQYSIEHPHETQEVNVGGTLNVLSTAREGGVRKVIYSASSSAYGDQARMPLTEDMLAQPKSPYGLQKYMGEHLARVFSEVYGLPTVSLRYFNVYGPGADPSGAYALAIAKFIKQRLDGSPITITGDGEQTRDFTHVRDIVRANILAAENDAIGNGEVINIGSGAQTSIKRIAELVGGDVLHVEPRLEPRHTRADNTRARELLGWEPTVSIEEGIAELKRLAGLV